MLRYLHRLRAPMRKPPKRLPAESAHAVRVVGAIKHVHKQVRDKVFPHLSRMLAEQQRLRTDDEFDVVAKLFHGLRVGIAEQETPWAMQLRLAALQSANQVNNANKAMLEQPLRRILHTDPFTSEPWLTPMARNWVSENVARITSIARDSLGEVEQLVFTLVRKQGMNIADLRSELEARFNVTEARARLIARDQVSKYNGQLSQARFTRAGSEFYVWRTSDDERVRPDHARLDGTVQRWDSPPITVTSGKRAGERNHPGGDIQCRCWADPILPDEHAKYGLTSGKPAPRTLRIAA